MELLQHLGCVKQGQNIWHGPAGKKGGGDSAVPWRLPPGVLETLEVFVMEPAQLAAEHAALDALEPTAKAERRGSEKALKTGGSAISIPSAAASLGASSSPAAGRFGAPVAAALGVPADAAAGRDQLSEGALPVQI